MKLKDLIRRPQIRVLGIDPSMTNTGWKLLEMRSASVGEDLNNSYDLTKMPVQVVEGGNLKQDDAKVPAHVRVTRQVGMISHLIQTREPDILAIESPVKVTAAKSTTGYAIFCGALAEMLQETEEGNVFQPALVVVMFPERLNSVAYGKAKTTGRETVELYKKATGTEVRVTEHEADAYFIAMHSLRFWATTIRNPPYPWKLNPKEQWVFKDSIREVKKKKKSKIEEGFAKRKPEGESNSMLTLKGEAWWSPEEGCTGHLEDK